jgi:hypothetical protein
LKAVRFLRVQASIGVLCSLKNFIPVYEKILDICGKKSKFDKKNVRNWEHFKATVLSILSLNYIINAGHKRQNTHAQTTKQRVNL